MVKMVSLSNKAYAALKAHKMPDDSFSEAVLKLVEKDKKEFKVSSLAGIWKGKEFDEGVKAIEEMRKNFKLRIPEW